MTATGLARRSAGVFAMRASQVGLDFLCGLAVARAFGAGAFGAYAIGMAVATLLAVPAALGFDRMLIRQVAVYVAGRRWGLLAGLISRSGAAALGAGLVIAAVAQFALHAGAAAVTPDVMNAVATALLLVPLIAYARVRQAALQGLGRIVIGQAPEAVLMPLSMLAMIGAAWLRLLPVPQTGASALALQCVAAAGACVLGIVVLRRSVPPEVRTARHEFSDREWFHAALPFTWMLGFNVLLSNADTLLVGWLFDAADAGTYRVASQMAMLIAFPLTAVNMAIAPQIAAAYARGERETLHTRAQWAARTGIVCGAGVYVALVLFGRPVLALFGAEFQPAYGVLLVLGVGYLATTAAGAAGYLLIMTRHARAAAAAFGAAATVQIAGVLQLAPSRGLRGAAIGTSLALIVLSITFVVLVRRRLGIDATILGWRLARRRRQGDPE